MTNFIFAVLSVGLLLLAGFAVYKNARSSLSDEAVESIKTAIAAPGKIQIAAIIFIVLLLVVAWYALQYHQNTQEQLRQAVTLTEQQAEDNNVLQNKLHISEGNAVALQAAYHAEKNKPATTFYVQAPTIQSAAEQVQQRINNKDQTLPPVALEKTDRTVVIPNETDYKVDVIKINLDKSKFGVNVLMLSGDGTEFGAGPSWKNRDTTIGIGYTTKERKYINATHYF